MSEVGSRVWLLPVSAVLELWASVCSQQANLLVDRILEPRGNRSCETGSSGTGRFVSLIGGI